MITIMNINKAKSLLTVTSETTDNKRPHDEKYHYFRRPLQLCCRQPQVRRYCSLQTDGDALTLLQLQLDTI